MADVLYVYTKSQKQHLMLPLCKVIPSSSRFSEPITLWQMVPNVQQYTTTMSIVLQRQWVRYQTHSPLHSQASLHTTWGLIRDAINQLFCFCIKIISSNLAFQYFSFRLYSAIASNFGVLHCMFYCSCEAFMAVKQCQHKNENFHSKIIFNKVAD